MRRSLVVAGAVAGLIAALPARAQQVPQPQQSRQPQQTQKVVTAEVVRPADKEVVSGLTRLQGRGSSPAGIKKLVLSFDDETVATTEPQDFQQKVTSAYEWDTYFLPESSKIARNGEYVVTVDAVSNGDQTDRATATVVLDNPPIAPDRLRASVEDNKVSLVWAANPEPDVLGYSIERSAGKGFKEVGRTRKPTFSEALTPGRYAYRVLAVRGSGASKDALVSAPSKAMPAVISAPPPPSGGGGSNDGGAGSLKNFFGTVREAPDPRLPAAPFGKDRTKPPKTPKTAEAPTDNRREEWGEYKRTLPYELEEAAPETHSTGMTRILEEVIPPDGARWVIFGGVLLLIAGAVAVMARRVKVPKGPQPEAKTPDPTAAAS